MFLAFAAFTTIIAVFECLIGGLCDEFATRRRGRAPRGAVSLAVGLAVAAASMPCVLCDGVLKWEDFAVSSLWLPLGALFICVFVTRRFGWGSGEFAREASAGEGIAFPGAFVRLMKVVVPLLILATMSAGFVR